MERQYHYVEGSTFQASGRELGAEYAMPSPIRHRGCKGILSSWELVQSNDSTWALAVCPGRHRARWLSQHWILWRRHGDEPAAQERVGNWNERWGWPYLWSSVLVVSRPRGAWLVSSKLSFSTTFMLPVISKLEWNSITERSMRWSPGWTYLLFRALRSKQRPKHRGRLALLCPRKLGQIWALMYNFLMARWSRL